jgi:hypothetical protein
MARDPVDRWLAAYNGEQFIQLDEFQHQARQSLINRAAATDPDTPLSARITYQKFRDLVDPEQRHWKGWRCTGIAHDLGCISLYEHQHGRPLPSSIVVYAQDGRPAPDFLEGLCKDMLRMEVPVGQESNFWRDKLSDFVSFWTTPGLSLALTDSIDTMIENVIGRLDASQTQEG